MMEACRCGAKARHLHLVDGYEWELCDRCHNAFMKVFYAATASPLDVSMRFLEADELEFSPSRSYSYLEKSLPPSVGNQAEIQEQQGFLADLEIIEEVMLPPLPDDFSLVERIPVTSGLLESHDESATEDIGDFA